jgi:hypothetical protein
VFATFALALGLAAIGLAIGGVVSDTSSGNRKTEVMTDFNATHRYPAMSICTTSFGGTDSRPQIVLCQSSSPTFSSPPSGGFDGPTCAELNTDIFVVHPLNANCYAFVSRYQWMMYNSTVNVQKH